MTELQYLNFDLLIERATDGYRARVWDAPSGQSPPVAFRLPFGELELENFLLRVGVRRRAMRGKTTAQMTQTIRTFGGQVYEALFGGQLQYHLLASLQQAESEDKGLRLRLRLADCPELADLPWEYLYDPARDRFLCLSERSPLVRYLELPDPVRALRMTSPLRVLVLIANPAEVDADLLDVEREWANLATALAGLRAAGQVEVERVDPPTLAALQQRLRRGRYHVLHFVGHGRFDPHDNDGQLLLEDQAGRGRPTSGRELGMLLYDHRYLRLAVLNACEGARSGRIDPFAGTAQRLVRQGIPAVVAMQFEISDLAAITFSQVLYEAVADGYPLDAATAQGRKAIYAQPNPIEWATPVLYMRAPDGHVFDLDPAPPTVTKEPPEMHKGEPTSAPVDSASPQTSAVRADKAEPTISPVTHRPTPGWPGERLRVFAHPVKWLAPGGRIMKAVAFSPNGRSLATGGVDWVVRVWDVETGRAQHTLLYLFGEVLSTAFSPDGHWLATGSEDKKVRVWDMAASRVPYQRHRLHHEGPVWSVAFSPDGRWLATGSADTTAQVWDMETGKRRLTLNHAGTVFGVAFSSGGRRLVTGGSDTARVWDMETEEWRLALIDEGTVLSMAVSPDGRQLVTGSSAKTARVWEVDTGRRQQTLTHDGGVYDVAFSPDGRWLATGSTDGKARVWDLSTGRVRYTLDHEGTVWSVAFSPDGHRLAAGTTNNRAVLWALEPPSRA